MHHHEEATIFLGEKNRSRRRNLFSRQGGNDMFQRLTQIISLLVGVMFFGGCLAYTPVVGVAMTMVQGPITATAFDQSSRTGKSCASSAMGLFAWGDSS